MPKEIYPRFHARILSLPLLGPHAEGFVAWLRAQGYPRGPICLRVHEFVLSEYSNAMLSRRLRVPFCGLITS